MQESFFPEEKINNPYLVLARKYRPTSFKDMIGQDILVRTFSNAINTGRLAHAFILTGIRGVGKTTTARIIARALNCIGADGAGNLTANPCGVCHNCKSINDDRHQDVLEMDAASHTGVGDIREIIENARYKPISARYKIYIIDEVHMLSNSAFNSLLKTLEEPPSHVKFIFATTEIRKIPITILSRCQRFDLKRVDALTLCEYYKSIVQKENILAEDDALKLIANVSGGSVRDGLSILDQAIAHSEGKVTESSVREMLGLSNQARLYDLFEKIIEGDIDQALLIAKELYDKGADPVLLLQDLLNINHSIARIKHLNSALNELTDAEQNTCANLAAKLPVSYLAQCWQMLLKGLEEVKASFFPFQAFEMVLIRLTYLKHLPSLEEVNSSNVLNTAINKNIPTPISNVSKPVSLQSESLVSSLDTGKPLTINYKSIDEILELLHKADEILIYHHLKNDVKILALENHRLVIKLMSGAPKDFVLKLQNTLRTVTEDKWVVIQSSQDEGVSLAEQDKDKEKAYLDTIINHKNVQDVLNTFSEMEITEIKNKKIV
jgi:DNA polymerase III subunit gamma/tau